MGKASIILVLGVAVILSFLTMGAQEKRNEAVVNSCFTFNTTSARNLAHSAANVALNNVTLDPKYRGSVSTTFSDGSYSASCSRVPTTTNSRIVATGNYGETSHTVEVVVETFSKFLKAAITARPPVKTLGTLRVDGRDHDENGSVIPNQGGYAIVGTETVSYTHLRAHET